MSIGIRGVGEMYDFPAIVRASRRFYKGHDLASWAKAIPRLPNPADDVETLLDHAHQHGFSVGFAFPPFALQRQSFDRLVDACARQPSPLLPDNQQYRQPFLADNWSRVANGAILQREHDLGDRARGPYVLLFTPNPLANCWGKTGKQIAEQFQARGWHGVTVFEYLVLQRHFAEGFGDHRFFAEPEDPGGHWLWLIDSMTDTDCAVALGSARGVNIQATGINNRESKRAAIAGVIVPLSGSTDLRGTAPNAM
jgi:hypothetical protein